MAPVVHGLEAEYGDRMNFVYLDIDDEATFTFKQALGYRYQPHIFLLDAEGNVIIQWVGFVDETALEEAIIAALGG
jgi:thioredoxin-like negative regulator of GroEL